MKPKLILHAGTHKTGTTAIQAFCAANRDMLAQQGLLYPTLPLHGKKAAQQHHDIAHALAEKSQRLTIKTAAKLVEDWAQELQGTDTTLLLSAEPLWRQFGASGPSQEGSVDQEDQWLAERRAYLLKLADVLKRFDTTVVLVFRNPIDFIQSLYIENINTRSHGMDEGFAEYLDRAQKTLLRYGENTQLFRDLIAPVQCLNYENLCENGLIPSFFEELGHSISDGGFTEPKVVRKSPTPAHAHILNAAKRFASHTVERSDMKDLLGDDKLQLIIEDYAQANKGKQFWEGKGQQTALFEALGANIEIMENEFGLNTSNWRESLKSRKEAETLGDIPDETLAKIEEIVSNWGTRKRSPLRKIMRFLR
ncbi:hypothetical protein [Celeribacter sp. ULVN23_4]